MFLKIYILQYIRIFVISKKCVNIGSSDCSQDKKNVDITFSIVFKNMSATIDVSS